MRSWWKSKVDLEEREQVEEKGESGGEDRSDQVGVIT